MFTPDVIIAAANQTIDFVAQGVPFQNVEPQAPDGLAEKFDKGLGFAKYIAFFIAIIGIIVAGAGFAISRREGSSEEATSTAIRIGFGVAIIAGATAIVTFFV